MPSLSNLIWPGILLLSHFYIFKCVLSFTHSFPFSPALQGRHSRRSCFSCFLGEQTEAQRGGGPCHHPACHGGTRRSHCVCQAGSGGEPVSVMKSPNTCRKSAGRKRGHLLADSTREPYGQSTPSPHHSISGKLRLSEGAPDVLLACSLMGLLFVTQLSDG